MLFARQNWMSRLFVQEHPLFDVIAFSANGFVTPPARSSFLPSDTSLASTMTEVELGYKIPAVTLLEGKADLGKPTDVNLADLIKGKKAATGAFTPGCSKKPT